MLILYLYSNSYVYWVFGRVASTSPFTSLDKDPTLPILHLLFFYIVCD